VRRQDPINAVLAGWTSDCLSHRLNMVILANVFFLAGPLTMAVARGLRRVHG
jgi:hypothetical protein